MDKIEIITKSLSYIEKNLKEKISVEEIAASVGYSKFHFSRMFTEVMNISVMEYVKERKVVNALEYILRGYKILDVAVAFGWESHSGFIKAFKSYYGFSPSILYAMNLEISHFGGRNMNCYDFYQKMDEHLSKEELLRILKENMQENKMDITKLQDIYDYCMKLYEGKKRYSGAEYITHCLNVSILLVQIGANEEVVYAGMFCDAFKKTGVSVEDIKKYLPETVADIITRLKEYDIEKNGLEDEECVVIKMAERLHNMRTIEYIDKRDKSRRAKETISIFMPVARKLKNERIINELNSISLKYIV